MSQQLHNQNLIKLYEGLLAAINDRDLEAVEAYSKAIQRLAVKF